MDTYACPKGHQSTEADFCSECGAKIQGAPAASVGAGAAAPVFPDAVGVQPTASGEPCPDCNAPRSPDSGCFCEICGYNFVTKAHGEVPVSAPPPQPVALPAPPVAEAPAPPVAEAPEVTGWTLVVTVDSKLQEPGSPAPPAGVGPFSFSLDKPVSLIGRKSETRAIFPEIPLDFDDAVSHRHALIERGGDGTLTLRDIGAANGTRLNGQEIEAMVDKPLKDGDEITLGHWSKITVKAVY